MRLLCASRRRPLRCGAGDPARAGARARCRRPRPPLPAADRLRPAGPDARAAAARRLRPGRLPRRSLLREAGRLARSSSRRPTSITSSCKNSVSVPSQNKWVPYDDSDRADRDRRLQAAVATNFLDDLVDRRRRTTRSRTASSARSIVYNMEERQRVKIVDYVGSKKVEQSKIDEELKKQNLRIRARLVHRPGPDPQGRAASSASCTPRRATSTSRSSPRSSRSRAATKLVNVTFHITEGPKVKIRAVDFVGNKAITDGKLERQDEGEQGAQLLARVHHRRRHLQGRQVRGRRRQGAGVLPRARLRQGAGRPAAS